MLRFFAGGHGYAHFASFCKGFGCQNGLLRAHIIAGWGRVSIFSAGLYVFSFRGPAGWGRVKISFSRGRLPGGRVKILLSFF